MFLNQLLFISAAAFTFSVSKSHLMGKLQPGSKFDPHLANLSAEHLQISVFAADDDADHDL